MRVNWTRVVLDEAHNIRTKSTQRWKSASELQARYRWAGKIFICFGFGFGFGFWFILFVWVVFAISDDVIIVTLIVTGTPIHNKLDDFYNLYLFLQFRHPDLATKQLWNHVVVRPCGSMNAVERAKGYARLRMLWS
jgi:hypothetical protein